jgi:hypothetical protein
VGIEYTLRTTQADLASVHLALSRLDGAVVPVAGSREIEFRSASSRAASMPDAVVQVEATSVYFRDNGGSGRHFLGAVVAKLCSFGSVTVEEL